MDEPRSMAAMVPPEPQGASTKLARPEGAAERRSEPRVRPLPGLPGLPDLPSVPAATIAPPFAEHGAEGRNDSDAEVLAPSPLLWCARGQSIVEEMLEVAQVEAESALSVEDREAAGDLAVRAVLLAWDSTGVAPALGGKARERQVATGSEFAKHGDEQGARHAMWADRVLFSRSSHPLLARVALAAALSVRTNASEVEHVLAWAARAVHRADPAQRSELALWLSEAWYFAGQRPPAALLELAVAGDSPHARTLAQLIGASPRRVAELCAAVVGRHGPGDRRAEAASWLLDTGADARDAAVLCARTPSSDAATKLRCVDLAIEARLRGDGQDDLAQLWLERAQLVGELSNGALDAAVSRALAVELDDGGPSRAATSEALLRAQGRLARAPRAAEAELGSGAIARPAAYAVLAALAESPAARDPHFGPLYLRMRALTRAIAAGDLSAAAELRRRLAFESPCPVVAACHAARGAVSLEVALGQAAQEPDADPLDARDHRATLLELAEIAHERVPSPSVLDLLDRAWLRRSPIPAQAVERLAQRPAAGRRWAAHLCERRLDDAARATALWRQHAAEATSGFVLDHLASCHRRSHDYSALADAYQALASAEDTPRAAAAWRCAAGALALLTDSDSAQAILTRAAEMSPKDPVSRVALLRLAAAAAAWPVAAKLLEELGARLAAAPLRRRYARERAILLGQVMGRPDDAEDLFENILAEDPLDADTLVALGELYQRRNKPMLAIAALRRAGDLLPSVASRVRQLIAVAELCRDHSELEDALSALEQAQRLDPGNAEVQRRLADLYEQLGHSEHAVVALRAELSRNPEPARRLEAQLRLATLLARLGVEQEGVVAAYLDALALDAGNAEALAGILAPARALGWWHAIIRAYRTAPPTAENLEILAESLERMESHAELARVRKLQLDATTDPAERQRRAVELAALYDVRLGDSTSAVTLLRQAEGEAVLGERVKLRRILEGVLERNRRYADLAALWDAEQAACGDDARDERVRLLLRLAQLRGTHLRDLPGAISASHEVLALDPGNAEALGLLDEFYEASGRVADAIAIAQRRASGSTGRSRASLYARVARLHLAKDDLESALAAYLEAAAAEPADREIFTTLERLCYTNKRWAPVLALYDLAIAYVEGGALRAYRLLDLYSRKAQVQGQYLGDLDGAIESLSRLLERDRNPEAAASLLEAACAKRGSYAPLVAGFARRAKAAREPARAIEAMRRAVALADAKLAEPATSARLRAELFALDPADRTCAAALEAYYREQRDSTALVALLQRQLELATEPEQTIELLRRIAEVSEDDTRDVESAVRHYSKILELDPTHLDSLEALSRIYEATERWTELIDATRKQIKATEDRNAKALLYFRCGSVMEAKFDREEDAIRYYEAAIKASSSCMPAIHGLRDLHRRRQAWPRVIDTLELELALWQDEKERAGVLAQIGQIYAERMEDSRSARQYFQEALTVDPDCVPANWALFETYFAAGDWDHARPLANALTQSAMRDGEPATRSEFYRKRGIVSLRTGDPRAAADSFVVALEIRPTNLEALEELLSVARSHPEAYEFETMYRELDKVYRRRDDAAPHLARVWIGLAALAERAGDLDASAELSSSAISLAPGDLTVVLALVELHCDMRRWPEAVQVIAAFLPAADQRERRAALLRQAEIHADGELDAPRAIEVLHEVLATDPTCHDAHYLLAQQHYLRGDLDRAKASIDEALALVGAGDAAALARYRYYRGRVIEAAGARAEAEVEYLASCEHDRGYPPPVLCLAQRAADAGDLRRAESLLIDAAREAIDRAGVVAAVPLQRGLARILLSSGDRAAAIEAYRGILAVAPDQATDRVALAEIYGQLEPARAIAELRKVLDRDIHHAPAYRLLASYYQRQGAAERAMRVYAALELLGFADEGDRQAVDELRGARPQPVVRRSLSGDLRTQLLVTRATRDIMGEVWAAFATELSTLLPAPWLGENLAPLDETSAPGMLDDYCEVSKLFEVKAEILLADGVPGGAAVVAFPQPTVVVDRALADDRSLARRFLFGWALDAIRGGYAALLCLGASQRRELTAVMRALFSAPNERSGVAAELARQASASATKVLEKYAGRVRDLDVGGWMDGMLAGARRSGLLACDDLASAIWMIARLAGESLPSYDATSALGVVLGGSDLIRYYMSDDYQRLREALAAAPLPQAP